MLFLLIAFLASSRLITPSLKLEAKIPDAVIVEAFKVYDNLLGVFTWFLIS